VDTSGRYLLYVSEKRGVRDPEAQIVNVVVGVNQNKEGERMGGTDSGRTSPPFTWRNHFKKKTTGLGGAEIAVWHLGGKKVGGKCCRGMWGGTANPDAWKKKTGWGTITSSSGKGVHKWIE